MEWISVKDRLPELETGVLATDGEHIIACELLEIDPDILVVGHNFGGYEWEWSFGFEDFSKITHWMPLPDPPQAE